MYAIFESGGKQHRAQEGDVLFLEKLDAQPETTITFDKVMVVGKEDGSVLGAPYVDGAKVTAKVMGSGRGKKITVFTYRAKKNSKRKMGHRQPYTKVQIDSISL